MVFTLIVVLSAFFARIVGWRISPFLYRCRASLCAVVCAVWGLGTALGLHVLIDRLHPGIALKILGVIIGAYVSRPSFGAFRYGVMSMSSLPDSKDDPLSSFATRNAFVQFFPLVSFVFSLVVFSLG